MNDASSPFQLQQQQQMRKRSDDAEGAPGRIVLPPQGIARKKSKGMSEPLACFIQNTPVVLIVAMRTNTR